MINSSIQINYFPIDSISSFDWNKLSPSRFKLGSIIIFIIIVIIQINMIFFQLLFFILWYFSRTKRRCADGILPRLVLCVVKSLKKNCFRGRVSQRAEWRGRNETVGQNGRFYFLCLSTIFRLAINIDRSGRCWQEAPMRRLVFRNWAARGARSLSQCGQSWSSELSEVRAEFIVAILVTSESRAGYITTVAYRISRDCTSVRAGDAARECMNRGL